MKKIKFFFLFVIISSIFSCISLDEVAGGYAGSWTPTGGPAYDALLSIHKTDNTHVNVNLSWTGLADVVAIGVTVALSGNMVLFTYNGVNPTMGDTILLIGNVNNGTATMDYMVNSVDSIITGRFVGTKF